MDGRRRRTVELVIDIEADAAMLHFTSGDVVRTRQRACNPECSELAGDITLDIGDDGRLVSIELRGISRMLPTA